MSDTLVTPLNGDPRYKPQKQGGQLRYPYKTATGDVLYATRQEAKGAIDWSKSQPLKDKIADVELLRKAGKTSVNDAWDPYYIHLARSLKGRTPQERVQQFETAIKQANRPIIKFPSDEASYKQFAQSEGVTV